MRNRQGFTLIELLLGMFFSSIILVTLFNSFSLLDRVSVFVDRVIDNDVRSALINNQLQKDISGAFIPVQARAETEKKAVGPEKGAQPKKEEKKKVLERVFIGNTKDNNLSVLSFITNNPLAIFEKEKGIVPKPRIVRVVYRLTPDKERVGSFILIRQEGSELSYDTYDTKAAKPIKGYAIAHLIKSMNIEYQVPKQKDEKEKQEGKDQKREFRLLKEWPEKDKEKKESKLELPQFVKVDLVLWDEAMENESAYTFMYEIFARE
jgi:hypothetical protein